MVASSYSKIPLPEALFILEARGEGNRKSMRANKRKIKIMKIRPIRFLKLGILMIPAAAVLWAACTTTTEDKPAEPVKPIGAVVEIKAPLGLPAVPTPEDNPPTAETIALGRNLIL